MNQDRIDELISCILFCSKVIKIYSEHDFVFSLESSKNKIIAALRLSNWCGKKLADELSNIP